MTDQKNDTHISVEEFQKATEELYKKNLELVNLNKEIERLNGELGDANEKLKGLDKLKTEFVSLASHQLRSPLTAIKGYASMLMDGDYGEMTKEAKEAIDRMYQSSKNLTIVVEDLLNVTKIESGGMKFEMAPFDLSIIVEDEVKDFSIATEKKGLKLNFEKDSDTSFMVNGDKEKIRQIIINFIDNSVKYTKEGSVNVSVKNQNNKVVFCVKDTGMGMTEEVKDSLFQKFARGDGARMNTTGTGLGLYLAKQIVEAHKGRVWVESEGEGKGSAFFMELNATK
ncbi:MAG: HAMP domain-containing sensor histidine kinase [Candidatus Paceibacterota bacterium]